MRSTLLTACRERAGGVPRTLDLVAAQMPEAAFLWSILISMSILRINLFICPSYAVYMDYGPRIAAERPS
jgi:hypothetical protein